MKKTLFLFVICFFFYSCEEACDEVSLGPPYFAIEIVDATTNENVFSNGTYSQNQLEITTPNSTSSNFLFISENNLNIINISPAWEEGAFTAYIKLNNEITIPVVTVIEKVSTPCQTNYILKSVSIEGFENSFDAEIGVYKIKI